MSLCARRSLELARTTPPTLTRASPAVVHKRFRSGTAYKAYNAKRQRHGEGNRSRPSHNEDRPIFVKQKDKLLSPSPFDTETAYEKLHDFFTANVEKWAFNQQVHSRLIRFGVPEEAVNSILLAFIKDARGGRFADPAIDKKLRDSILRFGRASAEEDLHEFNDMVYNQALYAWVSHPPPKSCLGENNKIDPSVLAQMRALTEAVSGSEADIYPYARSMSRRFIMHVGPTNSGKTHNALRALAAAKSGTYAGPLRMLAHEIWTRLNLGQIVPAGVDEAELADEVVDVDSNFDLPVNSKAVTTTGNRRYARECNMITGEEVKNVSTEATLFAQTTEMLNTVALYDVAVVDEIQLLGDPERGFAWTSAVMGLNANEIHLCGEETAVPLVREMLAETGDQLEIRRYERLSPLRVEDKPMGSLDNLKTGDCVISFSRGGIFAAQQKIEKQGMRAAIIYGKLPPEVRSTQAEMFNSTQCQVLIGSDAIGLGLNLKIRRVIFTSMHKNIARQPHPLSISQIKQIGGRAGRFGLHKPGEKLEGLVTAMNEDDMGKLREAMAAPWTRLPTCRKGRTSETLAAVAGVLPGATKLSTILEAHTYAAVLPPYIRYQHSHHLTPLADWVEEMGGVTAGTPVFNGNMDMTLLFLNCPIPWRDMGAQRFCRNLITILQEELYVPIRDCDEDDGFFEKLDDIEALLGTKVDVEVEEHLQAAMKDMEVFHQLLGMYRWLGFRRPVCFPDMNLVQETVPRVQAALAGLLLRIHHKNAFDGNHQRATWGKTAHYSDEEMEKLAAGEEPVPLDKTSITFTNSGTLKYAATEKTSLLFNQWKEKQLARARGA
ncbi:hypothetical protein CYLTODRAFT_385936 [Cylindrobasidium torrendii FP15055 ss-10]|uniref:Helicase C-terminal domain-containing protein n=1 Tax=Cylindrobasidium torrendii FP15055 ss-10 TaxID=1314674 RepID=A0A0D7BUM1_9AGAR|nr:hypothetical protein CYLTODRAFT_385936 [Cylindrobasidium torrendii FP15055 ss-10]